MEEGADIDLSASALEAGCVLFIGLLLVVIRIEARKAMEV